MPSSLSKLIAPVAVDDFFDHYWEQQPLHSRSVIAEPERLLSMSEIDHLIVTTRDDPEGLRGAYCVRSDENETVDCPILGSDGNHRSPALAKAAFNDGFTVVINHVHESQAPVSQLCAELEAELDQRVGCNLYLTPANAKGFKAHCDAQDTLFLQLEGSKLWKVWAPDADQLDAVLPVRQDRSVQSKAPDREPDIELLLERGDSLYMPRGWFHTGVAQESHSLHITLGVRPTIWADVLTAWLSDKIQTTPSLRQAIPLGRHNADRSSDLQIADVATSMLVELGNAGDISATIEQSLSKLLSERLVRPRRQSVNHFQRDDQKGSPALDKCVVRAPGLQGRVSSGPEQPVIRLSFAGGHVDGPPEAREAFAFLVDNDNFVSGDLPGLGPQSQQALVDGLVRQGFLEYSHSQSEQT